MAATGDIMAKKFGTCMECDEEIPYDSEECPECGLDGCPVAYRWYREDHEPEIIKAREGDDPVLLADLLFKAWYEAGSLPDYYVMGDVLEELLKVYREHKMYDRLVFQLCQGLLDYVTDDWMHAEEALALSKDIGREDLELYVYEQIDGFNWTVYKKRTPEEIAARKEEIRAKIKAGELEEFDPHLDPDMWSKS